MKYKATRKEIIDGHNNCICIPYCGLQSLLNFIEPAAYVTRREGWAADVYELPGNNCIVTGYACFGNIRPDYEKIRVYENKAQTILYDYARADRADDLRKLLKEFVDDVLNMEG